MTSVFTTTQGTLITDAAKLQVFYKPLQKPTVEAILAVY